MAIGVHQMINKTEGKAESAVRRAVSAAEGEARESLSLAKQFAAKAAAAEEEESDKSLNQAFAEMGQAVAGVKDAGAKFLALFTTGTGG